MYELCSEAQTTWITQNERLQKRLIEKQPRKRFRWLCLLEKEFTFCLAISRYIHVEQLNQFVSRRQTIYLIDEYVKTTLIEVEM